MVNHLQLKNKSFSKVIATLAFVLFFIVVSVESYAQQRVTSVNKNDAITKNNLESNSNRTVQSFYDGSITLQGPISGTDYIIGPEILTGISGFYDWQTNGSCPRYLYYAGPNEIHAIMMVGLDSADANTTRRTSYAFSSDGGQTWALVASEVPNIRSGFPTLTMSNNVAVIANHYNNPSNVLTSGVSVDAFSGLGAFTSTAWTPNVTNFIWPYVGRLTNSDVLIGAQTYQSGSATDTSLVTTFNPNNNTYGPHTFLFSPSTNNANMRWTIATGPNGRALYIQNPISDAGSPINDNRIFYFETTDNGATWGSAQLAFESQVLPGDDTIAAWLGMDAVYDAQGNFYITWNTTGPLFVDSKLWASKNGGTPMLVADHSMLPGIAPALIATLGNACTIDWPSISVSDDGEYVFVAYSVCMEADTLNGYNAFDLFYSVAPTSSMDFVGYTPNPVQITTGTDDERYVSLNRVALTDGSNSYKLPMVYMKDPQPGSSSFNDNAPISRASLIYREITQAHIVSVSNVSTEIPASFELKQNFPNPFNPATVIRFALPVDSKVTLKIYDVTGKEVAELINNRAVTAGLNEVTFNAASLPSGLYFYTLQAGDFKETKKMMLVK